MNSLVVKDIMTTPVVSVQPDTSLQKVNALFNEHKFNGFPVVDQTNMLVGLLTQYDLISSQGAIHFPTLQKVLSDLPILKKDKTDYSQDIASISEMKVRDVMNKEPLVLMATDSLEKAVQMFTEHHRVNPIPIVDKEHKVVGVISRFDVLEVFNR